MTTIHRTYCVSSESEGRRLQQRAVTCAPLFVWREWQEQRFVRCMDVRPLLWAGGVTAPPMNGHGGSDMMRNGRRPRNVAMVPSGKGSGQGFFRPIPCAGAGRRRRKLITSSLCDVVERMTKAICKVYANDTTAKRQRAGTGGMATKNREIDPIWASKSLFLNFFPDRAGNYIFFCTGLA